MYNAQFVEALKEALNGLRTIHSVGEEWCSYIGQIPVGGVPYCGQEVQRETYSALWSYAQAQGLVKSESEWQSIASAQGGNVPFYSSGDGSSTFRMPKLVGYVRGASGQSEAGEYVSEGLPNIEGTYVMRGSLGAAITAKAGAFSKTSEGNLQTWGGGSNNAYDLNASFDASSSNPIYGNSDHVTPETSVVLFGVYAFGEVSNVDALDAGTLASALARVESNMVDKTSPHIVEFWEDGTEYYKVYSNGWCEQGGVSKASVSQPANSTIGLNVTLYKEMLSADYFRSASNVSNGDYATYIIAQAYKFPGAGTTVLGITSRNLGSGACADVQVSWEVKGYAK